MLQFMSHGERQGIPRQTLCQHDGCSEMVVNERPAQVSEPVWPEINFDTVSKVDVP
jgi:hypothetical protein